jgi:BirA family biotin operon repressor/biotin-[acetyl-CoA-carboxylase] ligase
MAVNTRYEVCASDNSNDRATGDNTVGNLEEAFDSATHFSNNPATGIGAMLKSLGVSTEHIHHLKETDSTNKRAHELAIAGSPEGTVVIADCQTAGRGQFGRSWHSPKGKGIYLSIILRPAKPPEVMSGMTLITGLCIARMLKSVCNLYVNIKWPNDITVRRRKLAGVLTEMSATRCMVDYIIVGVGMNLLQTKDDFTPELRERATSVFMETGVRYERAAISASFLAMFHELYREYLEKGLQGFTEMINSRLEDIGQKVIVDHGSRIITGTLIGIDQTGAMILINEDGRRQRIVSGILGPA